MFRKSVMVAAMVVAGAAFAEEPAFTDATFKAGSEQPKDWNDADMWVGGEPADGPGATATVRLNGTAPSRAVAVNFNRNVTLGHILRPADDTQGANYSSHEYRDNLIFRWDQLCQSYPDQFAPMTPSWNQSMRHYPVTLTMDSGDPSTKASIQHLVPSATMNGKRFGFFIEPPITLMSDLYLKYIGPSDRTYGNGWVSNDLGSHTDGAMYLTGGISEGVAGKGVEIDNPVLEISSSYVYTPIFLGGVGTFTGPINITSGMLRLLGEGRFEGDCHAIGVNNHVYATTGNGVLDLAGTRAGLDGNTLHLGGVPARADTGTLINTNPDPLVPGEWAGPVVIESATKIGGYTQNPSGNNLGGGDIVLSGPISGSANVELINRREVVLAGDNSNFSGDWILSDGFLRLRGANPVGTGTLRFKNSYYETVGTGYRFGAADDVDFTQFKYDISNQNFRIDVAAGLEYHPVNGFKGLAVENARAALYKTGPGTLRLTEQSEYTGVRGNYDWSVWLVIDDGTVVMDYAENHGPKLIGSKTGGREGIVRFGENARLEIAGTPDVVGYWMYALGPGSCATVHFDDEGHSAENGFHFQRAEIAGGDWGSSPAGGYMNIEADPDKWELLTDTHCLRDDTQQAALYPSIRFPGEIWNGMTFTKRRADRKWKESGMYDFLVEPVPDDWYATDFQTVSTNATSAANSLVDVTPALCAAGTHAGIECAALRFNTPNGGAPVVLDLDGLCKVRSGTILITPNMGDTPVVIRGGHIVRDPLVDGTVHTCNHLRIINMNTNATVTIESNLGADIANASGTLVRGTVMFLGPGKTVFTGGLMGSGVITVNGGTLGCGDGTKLLASVPASGVPWDNKTWAKFREIYLYGGGLLEFTEDASWTCEVAGQVDPSSGKTYRNGWRPHYGVSGGGISVAKDKTLTMSAPEWEVHQYVQRGAKFIKAGEGTISCAQSCAWIVEDYSVGTGGRLMDWVYRYELRGGTVGRFETPADNAIDVNRLLFGGKGAVLLTAGDGTKLVGREFSTTRLADCNRASCDAGNGVRIVIPEGATVTHDRHATASGKPGELIFSALEWLPSGLRAGGLWAGAGTLVLTNSQGTAGMGWDGFRNRLFTGMIVDRIGTGDATKSDSNRYVGYVPALENARLFLPEDVAWYIGYGMDLDGAMPFRLGGLDGAGTIDCQQRWQSGIESLRVGSDDGESHDFSGRLRIARNGAYYGQLLKVGSNTQRISGEANELQTSARVLDGRLVLGHLRALDSTDQPNFSNYIYVGGDDVTAGMNPEFLVDCGSVELANEVRVLGCASDAVVPGVGAKSGVVRFAKLMVSNDCALVAESGATAQFDSITKCGSFRLSQRGAGTVKLAGDFAIDGDWTLEAGAALVVDGVLTVEDGAKLLVTELETLTLVPGQRYTLVSAGSIVGKFDLSGIAVPKGWKVSQHGSKVVLKEEKGILLIIR